MRDNIVHRAYRQGAKTAPVERNRAKAATRTSEFASVDLTAAVHMARQERIERDIREYAARKRAAA